MCAYNSCCLSLLSVPSPLSCQLGTLMPDIRFCSTLSYLQEKTVKDSGFQNRTLTLTLCARDRTLHMDHILMKLAGLAWRRLEPKEQPRSDDCDIRRRHCIANHHVAKRNHLGIANRFHPFLSISDSSRLPRGMGHVVDSSLAYPSTHALHFNECLEQTIQ